MFGLFSKRRQQKQARRYPILERIGNAITVKQRKLADYLQRKTDGCKRGLLYVWYFLFCTGFACGCVYAIWKSFQVKKSGITVMPIFVPKHTERPRDQSVVPRTYSEQQYLRIREFNRYVDSLSRSPEGKKTYDSLMAARPGLIDSARLLQKLYEQQNR